MMTGVIGNAEDIMRQAQEELKSQGFYFGEIDGKLDPANSAAIKRFQIRNGLEPTGTLSVETLKALGLDGEKPSPLVAPEIEPIEVMPPAKKPVETRKALPVSPSQPPAVPALPGRPPLSNPQTLPNPPGRKTAELPSPLGTLFARTPFANAPLEVQASTVNKVQAYLRRLGLYHEPVDGSSGPALEEAILSFQRRARLPLSGRLDLDTLNEMKMLPGRMGPSRPITPGRGIR